MRANRLYPRPLKPKRFRSSKEAWREIKSKRRSRNSLSLSRRRQPNPLLQLQPNPLLQLHPHPLSHPHQHQRQLEGVLLPGNGIWRTRTGRGTAAGDAGVPASCAWKR